MTKQAALLIATDTRDKLQHLAAYRKVFDVPRLVHQLVVEECARVDARDGMKNPHFSEDLGREVTTSVVLDAGTMKRIARQMELKEANRAEILRLCIKRGLQTLEV